MNDNNNRDEKPGALTRRGFTFAIAAAAWLAAARSGRLLKNRAGLSVKEASHYEKIGENQEK